MVRESKAVPRHILEHPGLYGLLMYRDAGTSGILTQVSAFTKLRPASGPNLGATERGYVCVGQVMAMLDFVMIALGLAFFAASVLYVLACERM